MARLVSLDYSLLMAHLNVMGFLFTLARLYVVGYFLSLARLQSMGFLLAVARLLYMGFLVTLALRGGLFDKPLTARQQPVDKRIQCITEFFGVVVATHRDYQRLETWAVGHKLPLLALR